MYSSGGIPGTGLYAMHHYRAPGQEHPEAQRSGCGALLLAIAIGALTGVAVGAMLSGAPVKPKLESAVRPSAKNGRKIGRIHRKGDSQ
jgi:hypothetical protein